MVQPLPQREGGGGGVLLSERLGGRGCNGTTVTVRQKGPIDATMYLQAYVSMKSWFCSESCRGGRRGPSDATGFFRHGQTGLQ